MFILLILFFIVFVISYVFIIYKLKLLDDDINTLYDKYAEALANSFSGGRTND
ncbi:unknown [Clostridium sp. CAG:780]|nr:unknown [Clostridium sp. CAG:780]